jgi:hypothetical protein
MMRWLAWKELPTTITVVSPGWASRLAVAAAVSSSAMSPSPPELPSDPAPVDSRGGRSVQFLFDLVKIGPHLGDGVGGQHAYAGYVGDVDDLDAPLPALQAGEPPRRADGRREEFRYTR